LGKPHVDLDYDLAFGHTTNFRDRFSNNMIASIGMLNGARDEFLKFRDTPASPSMLAGILDLGWALAQQLIPLVRFAQIVQTAEKAVRIANRWNQNAPISATLTLAIRTTYNFGEKAAEVHGKVSGAAKDISSAVNNLVPESTPPPELADADVTSKAVKEVVDSANRMQAVIEATRYYLAIEKHRRQTQGFNGSMYTTAQSNLPLPQIFTPRDMDEIKRVHLWGMISNHLQKEAKILKNGSNAKYVGLNDAQRELIWNQFGPSASRGKHFGGHRFPPAPSMDALLVFMGLPIEAVVMTQDEMQRLGRKRHGEV